MMFENSEICEAYRSIYDNPNISLNEHDGYEMTFARKLMEYAGRDNRLSKYFEQLIKWYRYDKEYPEVDFDNEDDLMEAIETYYITDFDNIFDDLMEYEENLKYLASRNELNRQINMELNGKRFVFTPKDIFRFRRFRFAREFMSLIRKLVNYLKDTDESPSSFLLDRKDAGNIRLDSRSDGYIVVATRTFETTNKFVYHLWGNRNMSTDYGNPQENSPYCTRLRQHWNTYSHGDSDYEQYWFLREPDGFEGEVGHTLADGGFGRDGDGFNALERKGPQLLVCMNDTFGDCLGRDDEKVEFLSFNLPPQVGEQNDRVDEVIRKMTEIYTPMRDSQWYFQNNLYDLLKDSMLKRYPGLLDEGNDAAIDALKRDYAESSFCKQNKDEFKLIERTSIDLLLYNVFGILRNYKKRDEDYPVIRVANFIMSVAEQYHPGLNRRMDEFLQQNIDYDELDKRLKVETARLNAAKTEFLSGNLKNDVFLLNYLNFD